MVLVSISHDTQNPISKFKSHMIRQSSLSYLGDVEKEDEKKHE